MYHITMHTVDEVISRWPTTESFARDLGVKGVTARAWKRRNQIPGRFWLRIETVAKNKGIVGLTTETLAAIHSKESEFMT